MREKTKYTGVYARKHSTRRHLGRQDVCYDITYKDKEGKKVWLKAGWLSDGVTAQLASVLRSEKIRELQGVGAHQKARASMTLQEAFAMYKESHMPKLKSQTFTLSTYKTIDGSIKDKRLDEITTHDIDRMITAMQEKGYSPQSIKHSVGLIKRIFGKMIVWGIYKKDCPTKGSTLPRIDAARVRFLSHEEAALLLDALKAKSFKTYAMAFVSLNTGMRAGEILNLTWQDVHMESKTAFAKDAKAGSRTVLLNEEVCALLLQMKDKSSTGLVFASSEKIREVSKTFPRCVAALGLNDGISDRRQKVVFHTLRHTFASWLAIKGVPLYVISQLLGHKSLEMTQRYAHLCPDVKRDAVNLLDGLTHK